jgi:hypothetical protein
LRLATFSMKLIDQASLKVEQSLGWSCCKMAEEPWGSFSQGKPHHHLQSEISYNHYPHSLCQREV